MICYSTECTGNKQFRIVERIRLRRNCYCHDSFKSNIAYHALKMHFSLNGNNIEVWQEQCYALINEWNGKIPNSEIILQKIRIFIISRTTTKKEPKRAWLLYSEKRWISHISTHKRAHTLYSVLNTTHRRVSRWINIVLNVNVIILYKSYFISFVFLLLQYFAEKTHQTTALWLISFIYCNNCNQCHSKAALYIRMRRIHCHAFRFHDLQRYVFVFLFFVFLIEINRKHVLARELSFVQ